LVFLATNAGVAQLFLVKPNLLSQVTLNLFQGLMMMEVLKQVQNDISIWKALSGMKIALNPVFVIIFIH